ncbi:autotransporter outer membrane beta-barrel domain-containing protein [Pseudomonas sp. MAFF212427]|uniref:Autotransporter outer membrane beta-barrel domain-containing protein n=2 Tax=Pseudomonas brassicae TaxID=2708063 RepID=A0A6B3NPT3_9PSED|nr:autotransporter outer membrane beta-barrel domain-containing protein [Pseudomonas brassicae]
MPVMLATPAVAVEFLDAETRAITSSTPADSYQLINGSVLNAQGAQTAEIEASNSTVNFTGGGIATTAVSGLRLVNSQATVRNAQIVSTQGGGMTLVRTTSLTTGSTASVTDSVVRGGTYGAQVTAYSELSLRNSMLTGTGANSSGARLLGGTLNASGGQIRGEENGVWLLRESVTHPAVPQLQLDNTHVESGTGSAVRVTSASGASIVLSNGTTLTGGNGVILELGGGALPLYRSDARILWGRVQVAADSGAVLGFDRSSHTGDVIVAAGGTATLSLNNSSQLTGRLDNVQQVNINSNSNWTLNADNTVGNLAMNGGQVSFGDNATFYRLNVDNLSGNGTFVMASDFSNGNTDFLNVTGNASGNHGLLIGSNGAEPSLPSLKVVHVGAGNAQFGLLNAGQQVDLGAYSYKLVQKDDQDWYLDHETRTISPMTRSVMALFNTAITVSYGELWSLRSRMGAVHDNEGKHTGVWMLTYGNQHNIADASSGVGYQQNQRGLTFGADTRLGESDWLVGVLAGHSRSDLNLNYGTSGSIDSYYVGGYATWMDRESGYYVDSVLKYNRYQNNAKIGLSDGTRTKGDYDTHGLSASVEAGRHIKLNDGYFIEPFAQVATAAIAGKDFTLDNGFKANGDVSRSLLGKVGTTVGKTISLGGDSMIQPYVKAAFAHEFAQRNQVQVNNNVFNNDLSGSRAELGAGVAWTVAKDFQVYSEAGYMNGKNIEMPYSFSLGASYRF